MTGASSGVGRAIARAFAAAGANVALIARNGEALENAASEMRDLGREALPLPLDVADAAAVDAAAELVVERWGAIDIWVNDAMVSVFSPVREMTADEFRRVTEVNYLGYVHGTMAALRHMRSAQPGGDHADRLGAGVSVHPASKRLLRVEGRHPGLHGLLAQSSSSTSGAASS